MRPHSPRSVITAAAALALVSLVSGCASLTATPRTADTDRPVATVGADAAAVTTVDAGYDLTDAYVLRPLEVGGESALPAVRVGPLSATAASLPDALRLLAQAAGLELVYTPGSTTAQSGATVRGLIGSLQHVLTSLSSSFGFSWHVVGNQLVVAQDAQYVVQLPPVTDLDSLAGISNTFQALGARDVLLDRTERSVVLRADGAARRKIEGYLAHIRSTRALVLYDLGIWEVTLSDSATAGLDWSTLTGTLGNAGVKMLNGAVSSTAGAGWTYQTGRLDLQLVGQWLAAQGSVRSLARPSLAVLAGTQGKLAVGGAITYVSRVSSSTSSAVVQTAAETATMQTGLQLALLGDVHDETVTSRVRLDLADLVRMQRYTAQGTELSLPQTATRSVETTFLARPGDTVLLGGISSGSDSQDANAGVTAVSRTSSSTRTELVIAIRPRVVKFAAKGAVTTPAAPAAAASAASAV